jgi:hypothetical protein
MKALIVAFAVLAFTMATESEDIALIEKIGSTTLGKTLFDTIYM